MSAESTLDLSLREAHRRHIAAQLPNLAWVVTGASILWFALALLADAAVVRAVASPGAMIVILALQGVIFAAAAALARRDPTGDHVTAAAVGACLAVGLVWVWLLTTTATVAAMLTFATLALLGAAPLMLAWVSDPSSRFRVDSPPRGSWCSPRCRILSGRRSSCRPSRSAI